MNTRENTTKKIEEKSNRIYDTLARVLSPGSECVAVALIGNMLYIAENNINAPSAKVKNSEAAETSTTVENSGATETLKNLQSYIEGKFIEKDKAARNNLEKCARALCSYKNMKAYFKRSAGIYTTNLHQQVEKIVFEDKISSIAYLNLKQNENVGYNVGMVAYGTMEMLQNIENLKKLKKYCASEEKGTEFIDKISNIQWVYHPYVFEVEKKGKKKTAKKNQSLVAPRTTYLYTKMHAEMKILSKVIELAESGKLKDTIVYIGISKSCCFHCRHTLDVANDILQEKYNVAVRYREAHNISFAGDKPNLKSKKEEDIKRNNKLKKHPNYDKWTFPFDLKGIIDNKQHPSEIYNKLNSLKVSNPEDIRAKIYSKATALFKANVPASDTDMFLNTASDSAASPDSSLDQLPAYTELENYIDLLCQTKKNLESLIYCTGDSTIFMQQINAVNTFLQINERGMTILLACFNTQVQKKSKVLASFDNISNLLCLTENEEKVELLQSLKGDFAHARIKSFFKDLQENMIVPEEKKGDNITLIYSPDEKSDSSSPRASRKVKRAESDIDDKPIYYKKAKHDHQSQYVSTTTTVSTAQPLLPSFTSAHSGLNSPSDSEEEENKRSQDSPPRKIHDRP